MYLARACPGAATLSDGQVDQQGAIRISGIAALRQGIGGLERLLEADVSQAQAMSRQRAFLVELEGIMKESRAP